jgi:hypothetical protein
MREPKGSLILPPFHAMLSEKGKGKGKGKRKIILVSISTVFKQL